VAEVAKRLKRKDHKITIVTEKFDDFLKGRETIDGAKIIRFSYPKIKFLGLFYIWFWFFRNRELIVQTDLIHIHDVFVWYLPFRFLFPKKPVFTTFHGYETFPIRVSAKIIRKTSEKLSAGNICIGDFMKKWYGAKSTHVSYGAVDSQKFKSPKYGKSKYDAVFSSRLDEQTDILTYLKTTKILQENNYPFRLIVLGDGKYRKEAEKIAEAKGFVQDPSPYFKLARFAFVSRYLAILEAFAARKLVFAIYKTPLKRDYLEMTPFAKWIIIEKSPRKLANKINYYMKYPNKAEEMIKSAYKWVKEQTWEELTNQYLQLWGMK